MTRKELCEDLVPVGQDNLMTLAEILIQKLSRFSGGQIKRLASYSLIAEGQIDRKLVEITNFDLHRQVQKNSS